MSNKNNYLTDEEFERYFKLRKEGDGNAAEPIIESLTPFIKRRIKSMGVSYNDSRYEDLLQSGRVGCLEALETFDSTKGCKFITYAAKYIYTELNNCFETLKPSLAVTTDSRFNISKINSFINEYFCERGEEPDEETISKGTGLSTKQVHTYMKMDSERYYSSLSSPIGDDDDCFLEDTISGDDDVKEELYREDMKKLSDMAIDCVEDERKKDILIRVGTGKSSVKEVAEDHACSIQNISQKFQSVIETVKKQFAELGIIDKEN